MGGVVATGGETINTTLCLPISQTAVFAIRTQSTELTALVQDTPASKAETNAASTYKQTVATYGIHTTRSMV